MTEWTAEQARRAILRRQGLTRQFENPIDATKAAVVVQTQYAVSLLPALAARSKGVDNDRVDSLLKESRQLVKTWANRQTVHTFARDDFGLIHAALSRTMCHYFSIRWKRRTGDRPPYDIVASAILEALDAGPLDRTRLHEVDPLFKEGEHNWGWGADVMGLAYRGDLVFAEQGASRTTFARRDRWIGEFEPIEGHGQLELFRRYLAGYGPASMLDFRMWAGLQVKDMPGLSDLVKQAFPQVRVEGRKHPCFVLEDDRGDDDLPPVRLLAKFDPLLMGWSDRSLFLDQRFVGRVVRPAGQIEATVLMDGKVAGTWRLNRKGAKADIRFAWFKTPAKPRLKEAERAAEALGAAWGFAHTEVSHSENETP